MEKVFQLQHLKTKICSLVYVALQYTSPAHSYSQTPLLMSLVLNTTRSEVLSPASGPEVLCRGNHGCTVVEVVVRWRWCEGCQREDVSEKGKPIVWVSRAKFHLQRTMHIVRLRQTTMHKYSSVENSDRWSEGGVFGAAIVNPQWLCRHQNWKLGVLSIVLLMKNKPTCRTV